MAPLATQATQAIYGNENWSTSVYGSDNAYLQARAWPLAAGRAFTDGELRAGQSVCILGATVRNMLFGGQDPLGSTIRLKQLSCQVIGVLTAKGLSNFGSDQDDIVFMPLRAVQRRITGNTDIKMIVVSANDSAKSQIMRV